MIYKVSIPAVGPDVKEIRVLEWHGEPGATFVSGDLVVELETHKALVEVRAGQPGVLRRIVSAAGDWAEIGEPLALFSDLPDEPLPADAGAAGDLAVEFIVD
ncbi:MAG TPA: lipoyl domain-containing protein [Caulobacteraceae bacterium]|nr:lipoyl domain-containing protein [Caulobacteraceae bacterium]